MIDNFMQKRKECFDKVNKLYSLSMKISYILLFVNIIQFFLIGTIFMGFSWILVLVLWITKSFISNKIDKLVFDEYEEFYFYEMSDVWSDIK